MKLFWGTFLFFVLFTVHRPTEVPTGGAELCGEPAVLVDIEESDVGPGFVACDVYNEFLDEDSYVESNKQNLKKLMAFRRKVR